MGQVDILRTYRAPALMFRQNKLPINLHANLEALPSLKEHLA